MVAEKKKQGDRAIFRAFQYALYDVNAEIKCWNKRCVVAQGLFRIHILGEDHRNNCFWYLFSPTHMVGLCSHSLFIHAIHCSWVDYDTVGVRWHRNRTVNRTDGVCGADIVTQYLIKGHNTNIGMQCDTVAKLPLAEFKAGNCDIIY